MRRTLYNLLAVVILLSGVAGHCKKKSSGGGTNEATLAVTLNPPNGSVQAPAAQTDFSLTVTITSTMPPQGVTIDVKAKREDTGVSFYSETQSASTSNSPVSFSITNTPIGISCITEVTVTSKTQANNKWTGGYHYMRKS